jgi:hypothetical protein
MLGSVVNVPPEDGGQPVVFGENSQETSAGGEAIPDRILERSRLTGLLVPITFKKSGFDYA